MTNTVKLQKEKKTLYDELYYLANDDDGGALIRAEIGMSAHCSGFINYHSYLPTAGQETKLNKATVERISFINKRIKEIDLLLGIEPVIAEKDNEELPF